MIFSRTSAIAAATLIAFSGAAVAQSDDDGNNPANMIITNANDNPVELLVLPGLCANFVAELAEMTKETKRHTVFSVPTMRVTTKRRTCDEKGVPTVVSRGSGGNYADARKASVDACNAARDSKTGDACVVVAHTRPVQ